MLKSRRSWWMLGIGLVLLMSVGAVFAGRGFAQRRASPATIKAGEVTAVTAVSSVEASGAVAAQQSSSLFWQTTGIVATVDVKVGDYVKAGDVLMTLDPASAPQSVILAQADLIAAQKALDELLRPTDLAIATARQAVAEAQQALDKANRDLRNVENPVSQSLYDTASDTKLALDTAQANLQLANVSPDVQAYYNNYWLTDWYFRRYQDIKAQYDANPGSLELRDALERAQSEYQAHLSQQQTLELRIGTDKANQANAVAKAQKKYDDAVANLEAAKQGPDANRLAVAQAKVAVAQATLADAQSKLDKLLNGPDPKDVTSATARVQAAQAAVNAQAITAPFAGEVLVITYQPGDAVAQGQPALVIGNRSQLHVDVSVDESEVSQIQVGNPVTVTLDSVPGLTLTGAVSRVNPVGQTVQGLVKYTVRVDLDGTDPRVLLGMTASAKIVTRVQAGVLAVPLDAVQLDEQGEFVNRVLSPGRMERVNIVSGQTQGDLVVIAGDLKPGDKVQLVEPRPTNTGSPFGPG